MKPISQNRFLHSSLLAMTLCVTAAGLTQNANATLFTWDGAPDGGGSSADANWSTENNWISDIAPDATGSTLTFGGTTNLSAVNNLVTSLANGGISFAAGAGSFTLSGTGITIGTAGGGGFTVLTQESANNQEISLNITLAGGGGDRTVVMSGAGSLKLSGNLNFSNSWLFPSTTAGTIILTGNNSGDGKGGIVNAGGNQMRATIGSNIAGTQLVLDSNTALGNASTGGVDTANAVVKGIQVRAQTNISSTGVRDLSANGITINANNVTFNGTSNMTIGHIINQGGNRDLVVSSSGQVTVSNSLSLSESQTSRQLYVNLSGTGGMVVNGKIHDTFHSDGLTTAGTSLLRKAGTGTLILNGDSSATFASPLTIEAGTLKLGNDNALGATGTSSGTTLTGNATLDLNGHLISESLTFNNGGNKLVNSSASAAEISVNAALNTAITVDATGDITSPRLIASNTYTVTKQGAGTLTTNGPSHNNLTAWDIQAGKVVFANTSGYGADRGVTISGGTLQLGGANFDLINNGQSFTINSGTFDLNGKAEAVASIEGTGGTVTNSSASAATLYVGGGPSGTSTASFAGAIQDGTGGLNLAKEGSGTQTLTGTLAYSGNTTVSQTGTLSINSASLDNNSTVTIGADAFLNLDYMGTDTVAGLTFGVDIQVPGEYGRSGSGAEHETDRITGDGRLMVSPPSGSGFTTWADANGANGQTPDQDHDLDGVPNGVEYFMGETGSTFTSNPALDGTKTVTWPKDAAYSGSFMVQISTDLVDWTDDTDNATDNGTSVVYQLTGVDKQFVRLVVTPN